VTRARIAGPAVESKRDEAARDAAICVLVSSGIPFSIADAAVRWASSVTVDLVGWARRSLEL
jgi:hypothetical protein